MNTNGPEKKFETMQHVNRWMILVPIAAMTIAVIVFIAEGSPYPGKFTVDFQDFFKIPYAVFTSLYLFVLMLFLITLIPLVMLLMDRNLKKIHFAVRFKLLSRFVFYAWIVLFASRLMLSTYYGVLYMPEVLLCNFIFGGLLVAAYFYFRKRYTEKPETMFP
jgi:hypothetical protein